MSKAKRIQINSRMDNLALSKNIRRFAQDSCFAGPHRTRNDQQRFRKHSIVRRSFRANR